MRNIIGSTLDPLRELGPYESRAVALLGEDLNHMTRHKGDSDQRDSQMRRLYEEFGWNLSDIGTAWGVSYETVRKAIRRAGGTLRPARKTVSLRYPG